MLYEEKDELYDIGLHKTRDKQYLLLEIESKDTSECRYLRADEPSGQFQPSSCRARRQHRYYLDHREDLFYIRTNKGGRNFAVMTAPENDPAPQNWKVLRGAPRRRAHSGYRPVPRFRGGGGEDAMRSTACASTISTTGAWAAIEFPEPVYAASPGGTPDSIPRTYRYNYQSLVTPPSVYDYDVRTGKSTLRKRQEVLGGYDPKQYVSRAPVGHRARRRQSAGFDRVQEGLRARRHGRRCFCMATALTVSARRPRFPAPRLSLLDRGMAYAIAHIRGGDEMGEKWREDGMLMKKKNTFFDFIDCAEYLIDAELDFARTGWLIEGGSAGGLLMGAVVNMRPDLFRAVHLAVPFVDVMNTMMDASLPLTVGEYLEWGNPNEKAAYDYMKTYSPYDNLEKRAYPAILVTTSFNDSQVMYWEPAKYVARLRTLKTDSNPLLLKIKMEPGRPRRRRGRYDRLHDIAFEYAWLLSQVGISK